MNKYFRFGVVALGSIMMASISYPIEAKASGGSVQRNSSAGSSFRNNTRRSTSRANSNRAIQRSNSNRSNSNLSQNRYNLGKRVLLGQSPLGSYSESLARKQQRSLSSVVERLPQSAKRRLDLDSISGRLSPEQLDAVKYYLQQRYLR